MHHNWMKWTIDLSRDEVRYTSVEQTGETKGPLYNQQFNEYHQIDHLTDIAFVEDLTGSSGNVSYFVDDLWVMTVARNLDIPGHRDTRVMFGS